jgi:hypothetical protein
MTSSITSCVCRKTLSRVVDITPWFALANGSTSTIQTSSHEKENNQMQDNLCNELLENLYHSGWSLVGIDAKSIGHGMDSETEEKTDDNGDSICSHSSDWTSQIQELFSKQYCENQCAADKLTFRSFESGAPGTTLVEPKLSWEITMANALAGQTEAVSHESKLVQRRMIHWAQRLHAVAVSVQMALQLPQGLLLHEETHSPPLSMTTNENRACIDLLRAFYYHPVPNDNQSSTTTFGSSPHTDWGSFTVFYQDDKVGGLQTYCRLCGNWTSVPTAFELNAMKSDNETTNNDEANRLVYFVVHIGDITSLAIHSALEVRHKQSSPNEPPSADDVSNVDNLNTPTTIQPKIPFPSPLHRVISPTIEPRASLVYFCYPPAERSIIDIVQGLAEWISRLAKVPLAANKLKYTIPYQDYYLLKNQSANAGAGLEDDDTNERAHHAFQRMVDKPVHDILKDKWDQVQRK